MNVRSTTPDGLAERPATGAPTFPTEVKDPLLVDARREQLASAAVELFIRHGYHPTSVRDIARAAGLSVGSVYTYFPSKDSILEYACETFQAALAERFRDIEAHHAGRTPAERLRSTFAVLVQMVDETSDLHLLIYREIAALEPRPRRRIIDVELAIRELFSTILDLGVREGTFRPHDSALRAQTIVYLAHMWALKRWWLGSHGTVDQFVDEQIRMILGDLATTPSGT